MLLILIISMLALLINVVVDYQIVIKIANTVIANSSLRILNEV
jgi:hypothetical protein